jgi:hypothetical protein
MWSNQTIDADGALRLVERRISVGSAPVEATGDDPWLVVM